MSVESSIHFKHWTFNPQNSTIENTKVQQSVTLEAKQSELLHYLISHQGKVISREELIEQVWLNRFVDDKTVNSTISRIRKILGGETNEYIKTHPKLGYSFNSTVSYKQIKHISINNKVYKKHYLYKFYAIGITLIFFVLLWLFLTKVTPPTHKIVNEDLTISPLTYSEGWESQASISTDNQLLAFTSKKHLIGKNTVIIQNLSDKSEIIIDESLSTSSPVWSYNSNELYYIAVNDKGCIVKRVKILNGLQLSLPEKIVPCGQYNRVKQIALSRNMKWLYFIEKDTEASPHQVKRFSLKTSHVETITTPLLVKLSGDIAFTLSPDDLHIAYIREFDDISSKVMVKNIETGETKEVADDQMLNYGLSWTKSPFHLVSIGKSAILNLIDIRNNTIIPLHKKKMGINTFSIISESEMLISLGSSIKADIDQININMQETSLAPLISSTFHDYWADIFQDEKNKKIAFISSRSGKTQVWLKNNNSYTQLTNFSDTSVYISDLFFSENGKHLLFKKNYEYYIYTLESKSLSVIKGLKGKIQSASWSCNSEAILYTKKNIDSWDLYKFILSNQRSVMLQKGVIGVENDCAVPRRYITKQHKKGIFAQDMSGEDISGMHFLKNKTFSMKRDWTVTNDKIFTTPGIGNQIDEFNINTLEESRHVLNGLTTKFISSYKDTLIINKLSLSDTYIAKVKLPKLAREIKK